MAMSRTMLDTEFNPAAFATVIGAGGGGLWDRVARPACLESDTPHGSPFTGRQFTNDEVYRSGHEQHELRRGEKAEASSTTCGCAMTAPEPQLAVLRRDHPAGASARQRNGRQDECCRAKDESIHVFAIPGLG